MTSRDKAIEYDRIAEYLKENGWVVAKCVRRVPSGAIAEMWNHPDRGGVLYNFASAYRVECHRDGLVSGPRVLRLVEDREEQAEG